MDKKEAHQMARALFKLMRSGEDARAQIDFICNSMRMKKKNASQLQKTFESGVHAGCDAVINGDKNSFQEAQKHPLYVAAYQVGRDDFKIKLDEQRRKDKPKRIVDRNGLILSFVLVLFIIFVILLIVK